MYDADIQRDLMDTMRAGDLHPASSVHRIIWRSAADALWLVRMSDA